jgi:aminoglycoside/choline kinase family phosphotransferase
MNSEEIIKYTSKVLPKLNLDDCKSTPINNGASDRDYFRINLVNGSSMVVMQYTSERPDNIKFDSATKVLKKNGILSPDIIYHDKENMMMWLEDLGSDHLWDRRDSEWNKRGKLYMSVIDEISKLHSNNEKNLSHEEISQLEPSFDKDLYKWEQDYFFDHFLSYYSRRAPSYQNSLRQESEFNELIENLTSRERFLIHRDLQSQNVIIHKKKPYFIDYQGLRLGLREYDIASLVYDPYVTFTKTQRDEIINYAFKDRDQNEWGPIFEACSCQRLMQALGAYSKLGNELGKTEFLKFIPRALENIRDILENSDILPRLTPYLSEEAISL